MEMWDMGTGEPILDPPINWNKELPINTEEEINSFAVRFLYQPKF